MQQKRLVRLILSGVGVIVLMIFLSGIYGSVLLLMLGLAFLFLGATDFGRQCPLILSVRHLVYRIQSKAKPSVYSVKPVEEIRKTDRNTTV
jgi:hypothetical protein